MRARPAAVILAALVTVALVMVGCAAGHRTGPGSGALSTAASDVNPVDRDQLADGGTLRWPLWRFPPNFNYHELTGLHPENASVLGALLPRPFVFDATGAPILNKDYVESAELTATDPQQVVTYRINPQAVWYDGTPITVADFHAQWKALAGSNPAFRVAATGDYDKIENVAAGRDEREVVVIFATKYADWRALFSMIYPAATNTDPNVFNDGWKRQPLTTAGPFKLESLDQTAQTLTLVRNERWWGRPAKLERIIYRVINNDAHVDALANGEIDLISIGSDVNRFQRALAIPGVIVRRAGAADFAHLTINGASEVLTDVRVRQALTMGIDRARIAQAELAPLGIPWTPLGSHIFLANQSGYQDNSGELGRYDPQRAKELLEEAGWKRGASSVRAKNGKQLTIRYVIASQILHHKQTAELVQAMLGQIGVTVEIETVPARDFLKNFIAPGNFDITEFIWLGTPFPISTSKSIYTTPRLFSDGRLDIQRNYARVGSDEIDRLFELAIAELDPAKAVRLANEIDTKIWQEVHSLPLYQRPDITAANSSLANFGAFGFASRIYEDIGFTKL